MTNTSSTARTVIPDLAADLGAVLEALQTVLAGLEPRDVPFAEVAGVWELFTRIRRLAGNGATLLAGRVAEAHDWSESGYPTPEEWMAARAGTTIGGARGEVRASERLGQGLDETAERMRQGRLSPEQAGIVADAAVINPEAERALCDRAEIDSNKGLRDEAARRKAQRENSDARAARHHRERRARTYRDSDGKTHLHVEGPTATLARWIAELEHETDRHFRAARREGRREGRDAYAFDALLTLLERGRQATAPGAGTGAATGTPRRSSDPTHLAMIRVDLTALIRGEATGDEICEIAGIGPISVTEARALLGDSILKLVCTRGVDVHNLTHLGRGPTRAQELAVLWAGTTCRVAGCHRTHIEFDHRVPYTETRHTRVDELDPLCTVHHRTKTLENWALVAGTGTRRFVPPGHPHHPTHPGTDPHIPHIDPADGSLEAPGSGPTTTTSDAPAPSPAERAATIAHRVRLDRLITRAERAIARARSPELRPRERAPVQGSFDLLE